MKLLRPLVATLVLIALARPAAAADALCNELKAFDAARFDRAAGSPDQRWVEVHWRGQWLDMTDGSGLACLHSSDQEATKLCGYLADHTSVELMEDLPQRIMTCKGSKFAGITTWHSWKSDIVFTEPKGSRPALLQINFADLGEGVIRYSTAAGFPAVDVPLKAMPPLKAPAGE